MSFLLLSPYGSRFLHGRGGDSIRHAIWGNAQNIAPTPVSKGSISPPPPTGFSRHRGSGKKNDLNPPVSQTAITPPVTPAPNSPPSEPPLLCPEPKTISQGWAIHTDNNTLEIHHPGQMDFNSNLHRLIRNMPLEPKPLDSAQLNGANNLVAEARLQIPKPKSIDTITGPLLLQQGGFIILRQLSKNPGMITIMYWDKMPGGQTGDRHDVDIPIKTLSIHAAHIISDFDAYSTSQVDAWCKSALQKILVKQPQ